jgi:peptide deformylase
MAYSEPPRRPGGKVRPVKLYGAPVLRQKALEVDEITDEIRQLIDDMVETMIETDGMGLAAPQVGESLRLFITCVPYADEKGETWLYPDVQVYINPVLSKPEGDLWSADEGCLSIPKIRGAVDRPERITVSALNERGERFEQELEGWDARCVMHENDHLNGVLYPDRMSKKDRREIEPFLRKLKKQS